MTIAFRELPNLTSSEPASTQPAGFAEQDNTDSGSAIVVARAAGPGEREKSALDPLESCIVRLLGAKTEIAVER